MELVTPNLLITDDNRALRETLGEVFQRRGFATLLAEDGQQALEIVHTRPVHLLLLDVHMPRLTGLEMMARLQDEQRHLPCILMTARLDDSIQTEAEKMHAYSILPKPVRIGDLSGLVRQALAETYGWSSDQ